MCEVLVRKGPVIGNDIFPPLRTEMGFENGPLSVGEIHALGLGHWP